jgi:hypothetical protein
MIAVLHTLSPFLIIIGYIIGLGAITVIDIHGWLGRTSPYWTEAATRTHKVTKPLIWLGLSFIILGSIGFFWLTPWWGAPAIFTVEFSVMAANGAYLSLVISPHLLTRERAGKASELLPPRLQRQLMCSFLVSWVLWWGSCLSMLYLLLHH